MDSSTYPPALLSLEVPGEGFFVPEPPAVVEPPAELPPRLPLELPEPEGEESFIIIGE